MDNDIELEISRGSQPGRFQVHVVRSPAGGDQREEFDLDVAALLRSRPQLEASILSSAVGARRVTSTAELPVRAMGQHLFQSLFSRSVYGAYRASLGVAQQQGDRLRVILRFVAPELAALPWEALFDPERQTYLCRQEPMVRRVPAQYNPRAPLQVDPPLHVLAMVASPRGLPLLDVDRERANLDEALGDLMQAGLVDVTWVEPATWRGVHRQLLSGHWHVVHFIGHGDYDERREEGVLAFVGNDGRPDLVEAARFADLLGEADPTPRLVVLNACSSGEGGSDDMLSAIAPALVHSGIEAVAAMQFAVSDDAAIAFAQGFYTAVAQSRGVDEAARSGRIAILGAAGSLEWLTPVLYLRGDSTHPIVMRPIAATPEPVPEPPAPAVARGKEPAPAPAVPAAGMEQPAPTPEPVRPTAEAETYDRAVRALAGREFGRAVRLFDEVLALSPRYRDALSLREQARRGRESDTLYGEAKQELAHGRYDTAARLFDVLLNAEPQFRDAAELRTEARRRGRDAALRARESPQRRPPEPPQHPGRDPGHDHRRDAPDARPPTRVPPASQGPSPAAAAAPPSWWSRRRVVAVTSGGAAVLLLAAAAVVLWPRPSRLSDATVLVPVRAGQDAVRLMTYDTGTRTLAPWAGAADEHGAAGSTPSGEDRFSASPSPDRRTVVFLQERNGYPPVPYLADAEGRDARRLMTSPDRPCDSTKRPAWSEDGKRLAVVCLFGNSSAGDNVADKVDSWGLWVVDAEDGAGLHEAIPRQSTTNLGAPTWDEASHLIYTWQAAPPSGGLGAFGRPVSVRDDGARGTQPQPVPGTQGDTFGEADWAPPGLLMVKRLGSGNEIVVVTAEGVTSVATGPYASAAWSPDHASIIATRGRESSDRELVTFDYPSLAAHESKVSRNFGAPVWGPR